MDSQKRTSVGRSSLADPHHHAMKIAEAVDETWHRYHGSGRLDIPLSVIAALAFIAPSEEDRAPAHGQLLALTPTEFAALIRTQWTMFVRARPDLINRAWPLIRIWFEGQELDAQTIDATKAVADAAIRAGQLDLTGTTRRQEVDLFGALLTVLRSRTAASARGQFYTPPCVADLMARLAGTPDEGDSFGEPTVGTGGMLRAAAEAMRAAGRDPATVTWWGVDIDELAVACLTVNAVLWNLGPKILLGVGNALADDDWMRRAHAEREETLAIARVIRNAKAVLSALTLANIRPESEWD